ncbi:MAG: hypothetical protein JRG96_20285, partial [Deltaproteobacteria bacterium]|nr:hypothetical protein [Deltaproteobacteria bacterium]
MRSAMKYATRCNVNRYARMTMFWVIVLSAVLMSAAARTAEAARRTEVKRIVVEEAIRNGNVPPSLALAVARVESNFDPRA